MSSPLSCTVREVWSGLGARGLVAVAVTAALAGCGPAPADGPPGVSGPAPITILGATLIDGTGAPAREDTVVVIRGNRIALVGDRADTPVPKGGHIVDGAGHWLVPGLIDLHTHYGGGRDEVVRMLQVQLRFGVTTVRSMGSDGSENRGVFADVAASRIDGPRIFHTGRGFSHPDGNPTGASAPATPDDARIMVRTLAEQGAVGTKMWVDSWYGSVPKIEPDIQAAIVDETTQLGLQSVAHIFDEEDVRRLADLGVTQFLHAVRSDDVSPAFVELARRRGLSFAPALSKAQDAWYLAEHPEALDDPGLRDAFAADRLERLLDPAARADMMDAPGVDRLRASYEQARRFVRAMRAGGVTLAVGSDSGAGYVAPGWGTHHELRLLVEAGLPPLEALTAATGTAARLLAGDSADFGTIVPGRAADLVLLTADPLEAIEHTRRIGRVMQAGVWVDPVTSGT